MNLLLRWVINALALLALPYVFDSIRIEGFYTHWSPRSRSDS